MVLGAIAIRVRVVVVGIDDPFAVHQLVLFGAGSGAEGVTFGVPMDAVRLRDGRDTWLVSRMRQLVQGFLTEHVIIQLRLTFGVQGETADPAFGFTVGGFVAIILGASGTKFHDVVAGIQFVGEIPQKITEWRLNGRILGSLYEDDRIRVRVEDAVTQMVEGFVQVETSVTGRETGHKDVQIGRVGLTMFLHLVVDFHPFFLDRTDPTNIVGATIQKFPGLRRLEEFTDLGLIGLLTELAPDGVEHLFAHGPFVEVLLDVGML